MLDQDEVTTSARRCQASVVVEVDENDLRFILRVAVIGSVRIGFLSQLSLRIGITFGGWPPRTSFLYSSACTREPGPMLAKQMSSCSRPRSRDWVERSVARSCRACSGCGSCVSDVDAWRAHRPEREQLKAYRWIGGKMA